MTNEVTSMNQPEEQNRFDDNQIDENQKSETAHNGNSNQLTIDNLPSDVKDMLPEEAQRMYIAAYNSIISSGNEETARRVAWQTIEQNEHYAKDDQGKWHRLPDNAGEHASIHVTAS
jgi:cation transport regulator